MSNERNKRIHALVFPGECWEHARNVLQEALCYRCNRPYCPDRGPDWFGSELPDNLRVAMVTAAIERFKWRAVRTALVNSANHLKVDVFLLPAPAIAEAIDRLILEMEGEPK